MSKLIFVAGLIASLFSCSHAATASTSPAVVNSVALAGSPLLSPVLDYLYNGPNKDNLTIFSNAIIASALEQFFNQTKLAVTIFVPTNDAFEKRLSVIQTALNITRDDIFSFKKQFVLAEILKYHVIPFPIKYSDLKDGEQYATQSNLCSNSKDLKSSRVGNIVTLNSAGRINATIIGSVGVDVKSAVNPSSSVISSLYFIDDMLLPEVVTTPLSVALGTFVSGQGAPDASSG